MIAKGGAGITVTFRTSTKPGLITRTRCHVEVVRTARVNKDRLCVGTQTTIDRNTELQ